MPRVHVTIIPADFTGCGHFRCIFPAQAIASDDIQVRVTTEIPIIHRGREVLGSPDPETDVIVIQRPIRRRIADVIPFLKEHGAAVVVEIDDHFHELHEDHPMHDGLDENVNADHCLRACLAADLVTTPTQALIDAYAPADGRGIQIRNYLPGWAYAQTIRRPHWPPIIGWSGSARTHPGDLEVTDGAVMRAARTLGARLHVVGPPIDVAERLGAERGEVAWGTGLLALPDYYGALREVDLGIVPLADTLFNESKSCLTGLSFAAAGVPFIASPTTEYAWLAEQGIGLLARTPADWEKQIRRLLTDRDEYNALAERGLQLAYERFRLRDHTDEWVEAWDRAMLLRAANS